MNIRDLMTKLDTIAEADATGRIDYKANQSQDAKEQSIAYVKKLASTPIQNIPRLGMAIDPKTGQIFYGEAGEDAFKGTAKGYPFDWMQSNGPEESKQDAERIRASGLQIVNKGGYAYVDPTALANIDKPQPDGQTLPQGDTSAYDSDVHKLQDLTQKLIDIISKKGTTPTPSPQVKPQPDPKVQKLQQQLIAKGAKIKADGIMGPLTRKAMQQFKENTSLGLKSALLESFGYQLNELELPPSVTNSVLGTARNAILNAFKTAPRKIAQEIEPEIATTLKGGYTPAVRDMAAVDQLSPELKTLSDRFAKPDMHVTTKDGKVWGRDPSNIGEFVELDAKTLTPKGAIGIDRPGYLAHGQLNAELQKLEALGPQLEEKVMSNPAVTTIEKEAIKSKGIVAWIKENPKRAAALGLITATLLSLLLSDNGKTPPSPGPNTPFLPGPNTPPGPVPSPQIDPDMQSIMDEMNKLITSLSDTDEPGPEAADALKRATEVMNQARGLGNPNMSNSKIDYAEPATPATPNAPIASAQVKESDELARLLKLVQSY